MLIPLIDDGESEVIITPDGGRIINSEAIDADWNIVAVDGGATPMTDLVRKAQLIQLVPVLASLGVPPSAIKEELIRLYGLPPTFLEEAPQVAAPPLTGEPLEKPAQTAQEATSKIIGGA